MGGLFEGDFKRLTMYYKLDKNKKVVKATSEEFAKLMMNIEARKVAKTKVGICEVSTVFLGMNHAFRSDKIIVFESMVFGGNNDGMQRRYSTWDEAVKGHNEIVEELSAATDEVVLNDLEHCEGCGGVQMECKC